MCAASLACDATDPLEEALRLQSRGDYAGSIEPLRVLLEERTDDPRVDYLYGRAMAATGQASLGEWALRKAATDPEWLIPAGTQLAVSALRSGNFDTAIEAASQVLEVDPDNIDVMLIRAKAYAQSRRHKEEALAEADRILDLDPTNTDAMEPRILALLGLERIDEVALAIDELGRMIDANEDASDWIRGWHCATAALFAQESDEAELASEQWEDCTERFPGHSNVVGNALKFYDNQGNYARSLEILQAALEAEPNSFDYRRRLALRSRYAGKREEAKRILLEGTEIAEPKYRPAAWQTLAKYYQDTGDHEAAIEAMQKAVEAGRELGSVAPQLLFDYADALVLRGNLDAASEIADEMALVPHQEMIRARIAQEQGDHLGALDHYEQAFRLWPDNPWARYFAARAAESSGQFDRAESLYRYSIRIRPDATDARYRLASLLAAQGNLLEALPMLRLKADTNPLSLDGELLSIKLYAWLGQQSSLAKALKEFAQRGAPLFGRALAAAGEGARAGYGPEAAAQMLERYDADQLRVQDPNHPDALIELLESKHQSGSPGDIERAVRAAVAARPDVAALHAVLGVWLEFAGKPEKERRAVLEKALELDPSQAYALAAMGRLEQQAGDPAAALDFFDRAAKSRPDLAEYGVAAARVLVAMNRTAEATERLTALLELHPHSAQAAAELVTLHLSSGSVTAETEAFAKRAVRFGHSADDLELLARVYRELDDPRRATEVEARARLLRETRSAPASPPA